MSQESTQLSRKSTSEELIDPDMRDLENTIGDFGDISLEDAMSTWRPFEMEPTGVSFSAGEAAAGV